MFLVSTLFAQTCPLSSAELALLEEKWTVKKSLKRNEFLVEKSKVDATLYFVHKGTFRIYYPHEEEEICVGFGYANTLLCAYPSFIKELPSEYYIQALTEAELTGIAKTEFYALLDRFPALEKCCRLLTEEALLGKIEREVEMLTFTPDERYSRLAARSPHLFQLIPLKYIASYLGIQPETLSRIRGKRY